MAPVLILSDVHANLVALEAVLADAGEYTTIWNLGDTIGYGPRPLECLQLLDDAGASITLSGNHDLAAVGMIPINDFNRVARDAAEWTSRQLTEEWIERVRAMPSLVQVPGIIMAHGSPRSPIWEYLVDDADAKANFKHFDEPLCLVGHSHVQHLHAESARPRLGAPIRPWNGDIVHLADDRYIINPGSVGQPRDLRPTAAYALFDAETNQLEFRRVRYDIEKTQAQMRAAGLPEPLILRLDEGV